MSKYTITFSDKFKKNYKKLDPYTKKQLQNKLTLLMENPMHPSLRTKHIKGTDGLFEFSVNMNVRVIWHYEDGTIILLLDIGHHDILDLY